MSSLEINNDNEPILVSIITAVFNGEDHLRQALQSIRDQDYPHIELVVVDGNSTDTTPAVIEEFSDIVSVSIRESDKGIYDAWNKGVRHASGSLLTFCNADDFLSPQSVSEAVSVFRAERPDLVYGNVCFLFNEKIQHRHIGNFNPSKLHVGVGFMTTSTFFSRSTFDELGLFDDSYRIAGDTEFLLRMIRAGKKFSKAENLTYMRRGGISSENPVQAYREYMNALRAHGYFSWRSALRMLEIRLIVFVKKIQNK